MKRHAKAAREAVQQSHALEAGTHARRPIDCRRGGAPRGAAQRQDTHAPRRARLGGPRERA
jgi:hypothetical protein